MSAFFLGRLPRRLWRFVRRSKSHKALDLSLNDIHPLAALARAGHRPVLITVRLDQCRWTGATGFPYGPDAAHPYVRTLVQYHNGGKPAAGESYLSRYYASFQPRSLAEFQGLGTDGHPLLSSLPPLNIYPWSSVSLAQLHAFLAGVGNDYALPPSFRVVRSCGPKPADFTQARLDRLIGLYNTIKAQGFRTKLNPKLSYFDQFPVGDVMVRGTETRIILANGQHRAAVLSALGRESAPLLLGVVHPRGPYRIDRSAVDAWPLVRDGLYHKDQALRIFDGIFDANGQGPRSVGP